MKKVLLTLFAVIALAGGAWAAADCCKAGADCCAKACCKKAH